MMKICAQATRLFRRVLGLVMERRGGVIGPARRIGEIDRLVIRQIMRRRGMTSRYRHVRKSLEIGDGSIAPPLRFLLLNAQESGGLRPALLIDMGLHGVPGLAHLSDRGDTGVVM